MLALLGLLRPSNWLKNLLLFFPPFLSGSLAHHGIIRQGLAALGGILLCLERRLHFQ